MTWGEIQISALKKMFAKDEPIKISELSTLREDDDTKVYLNNMIEVANEAISRILAYCDNNWEYSEEAKKYVIKEKYRITEATKESEKIKLPEEACDLIPLYIASQLYKDDDIAQATQYRNEFETGLQELVRYINNQTEVEMIF